MFESIKIMPFQLALILGMQQRDILYEIESGRLKTNRVCQKLYTVNMDDLIWYLHEHPENVGRIYCDDIPGTVMLLRKYIVNRLEEQYDSNDK